MSNKIIYDFKKSPVIVQSETCGEESWENMFHMTIQLAKNRQCSFHLFDLNQIIQRFQNWQTLLPRVKPFLAHSFQRDPKIAYILGSLGAGFSCATYQECVDCLENCPRLQEEDKLRKEVVVSNPFKLSSDMKNCRKLGIKMTTFMCKSELDRIKLYWPDAELILSVVVNPDLIEHALTCSKLAAHPDQIEDLLAYAKQLDLMVVGLLCYFGTNFITVSKWKSVPQIAFKIIETMKSFGFHIRLLNLGDGFDCIDQENEKHEWLTFQEDLSSLNNELSEFFPHNGEIELIAQLGKYFTQKAELFAFKVMGKRSIMENSDEIDAEQPAELIRRKRLVLIIENSQYLSFNFHPGRGSNSPNFWFTGGGDFKNLALLDEESEICTIYGFTCDSLDVISEKFLIPESIAVGDYLLWVNRGTYGSCLRSQFNGMKSPEYFYFINKDMLNKFMELCNITSKGDLTFTLSE